jgi:hypothetical protein
MEFVLRQQQEQEQLFRGKIYIKFKKQVSNILMVKQGNTYETIYI